MDQLARETNAWACYDCGKCTATCPLARAGADYSPRRHVLAANAGGWGEEPEPRSLADCLTCRQCDARCPAEVDYTGLVLALRERAHGADGAEPDCPHGGALQSMMRMMARGATRQDRLGWVDDGLATDPASGEVLLWTGCTAYYDAFFPELGVDTLAGTRAAVRILNALGQVPVVSPDERCCGHDLLWNGDRASFEALARHNAEVVRASGAAVVVTPCAECARTWRLDYPRVADGPLPRVVHLAEYLDENLEQLRFGDAGGRRVTFQDPCRLGRHLGVLDAPRRVLAAVPGLELVEMPRSGGRALCCAGGSWTGCDRHHKRIQVDRLCEARATGADVMVTACPKCQVHLRCAVKDPKLDTELGIEMRDVAEVVAAALA